MSKRKVKAALPTDRPAVDLVDQLRDRLLSWFDDHQRQLPWRSRSDETPDPYRVWLSEVMLQQTQVVTVIPYYQRFLKEFPTLAALAAAPNDKVFALWSGLGYYSRCRHLLATARMLAGESHSKFPTDMVALLGLPGFGRYTAGAVASIAFGQQVSAVDGNVMRVLSRIFLIEGAPGDRLWEARICKVADQLVPIDRCGDWNQSLIELGATICRKQAPRCDRCPVATQCMAFAQSKQKEVPATRVRAPRKPLLIASARILHLDKLLVAKRRDTGLFGGLWELPSVELRRTIPPVDDYLRGRLSALVSELDLNVEIGAELAVVRSTLTHRELVIRVHNALLTFTESPTMFNVSNDVYSELRWVSPAELRALGQSTATRQALLHAAPDFAVTS